MIKSIVAMLVLGISLALSPSERNIYADNVLPDFITIDGEVNQTAIRQFQAEWMLIPENVRNSIGEHGWKIIITDGHVGGIFYNDFAYSIYGGYVEPAAVTDCDYHVIYFSDSAIDMEHAVAHEVGHYIDSQFNFPSESAEFAEIFYEERYSLTSTSSYSDDTSHYTTYPQEFFAETAAQAIKFPELSQSTTPKSYEFVMKYIMALQ